MTARLAEKYATQSLHYLRNALDFLDQRDYDKASEFLWGSMAEAIKAMAASKGLELRSHTELWDYARGVSKETGDVTVYDSFFKANSLHSNFYESRLKPEDVWAAADSVRSTVGKIVRLLGYQPSL